MAENPEYNFAVSMLSSKIENVLPDHPSRDFIFNWALSQFKEKPVTVFQVGAIETFRVPWRLGSGWSDTIFGPYIAKNGGKLTVIDINLDNIAHSMFASTCLDYEINVIYGDAIDYIGDGRYDIYYLDGGNDPQETLDQFNKIKDKKSIIIVDDYSIKGSKLPSDLYVEIYDIANKVGVIDMRE